MPRPLGPPVDERPNWPYLNEGQRRYAWEQYNLAKVRHGIPIDHPIPDPPDPELAELDLNEDEEAAVDDFDVSLLDPPTEAEPEQVDSLDEVLDRPVDNPTLPNFLSELNTMADQVGSSSRTPEKRPAEATSDGAGGKKNKAATPGKAKLPGTAKEIGGENIAGSEVIARPFYSSHSQIRTYKKVHRLISFGLAYKPVAVQRQGTPAYSDVFMVTPMAHIPWEFLFMYMNPSEFALLPPGSRAIHMRCSVKAENIRIAFPTNASESNLATLNQNKFLRVGRGLSQNYQGVNAQPTTFVPGQPMVASGVTVWPSTANTAYESWISNFYGVPNNDTTEPDVFTTQTPRHQFGIPYVCQYYFMPVTQTNDPLGSGWEDFQSHLEEIKVDGPAGVICEMEYKPKMGLLKEPLKPIWTGIPSTATPGTEKLIIMPTGAGNNQARNLRVGITNDAPSSVTERISTDATKWIPPTANFTMTQFVEKSQILTSGLYPDYEANTCPSLHVGVMPVPALTTSAIDNVVNNSSFTDAQAYFEVECELDVACAFPTRRPLATTANIHMGGETWQTNYSTPGEYNRTMAYGLFQN